METQSIAFIDTEYRDQLVKLLRANVFHVTTVKAYRRILKDRFIFGNQDDKYPINVGSLKSFGRYRGWVCLFDLREKSDKEIEDSLMCYNFLGPSWFTEYSQNHTESKLVYLLMSRACYEHLVPNQEGHKSFEDGLGYTQYIPNVEVWFPGKLSIALIAKVLCVRIRNSVSKDNPFLYAHHKLAFKEQKMKAANERLRLLAEKTDSE
jgi:hypothetical protein